MSSRLLLPYVTCMRGGREGGPFTQSHTAGRPEEGLWPSPLNLGMAGDAGTTPSSYFSCGIDCTDVSII